ncbi:MAG: hypothetical protein ACREQ1_13750 [Woeseiaceae bacterium]
MPAETATDSFIAEFSRRYLEHRPPSLGIGRRPAVLVVECRYGDVISMQAALQYLS